MAAAAGRQIAGYHLLRRIGQGAHGAVYLAEAPDGTTLVALKAVPLPGGSANRPAREAFLRSAETARRLAHPDIVSLFAAGVEGDIAWLAMEPVPGSDLSRYTQPSRLLPEVICLRLAARVARALAHAHRQGVIHRDVKPANILVDWPRDLVKLADFGLARADDGLQTGTGIVPGSPAYMAPEQLAGQVPTVRSDLYALGATLFQLLTGQLPHVGASMGELLRRVAEDPAPDACLIRPGLPAPAGELVQRLLAPHPGERPASADEAARQIDALANSLAPPT